MTSSWPTCTSDSFPASAAWLTLAAISHNLLRAAGSLASLACAKARGATCAATSSTSRWPRDRGTDRRCPQAPPPDAASIS
jgi:hypothetical protein